MRAHLAAAVLLLAAPALADPARPVKTLQDCIQIALRNHPTLGSKLAATDAGRARVRQALSGYLPELDGSWSTDRTKTSSAGGAAVGTGSVVASAGTRPFTFHSSGFSLTQVLFDFGRTLDAFRAARAREESLQADEETQRQTVVFIGEAKADLRGLHFDEETQRQNIALEVRQAVLNLQEAAERISVSQRAAQQARENLELAEARYRAGVGNVIELTDAEATRASADADSVRARYSFQTALASLEKAIGGAVPAP